MGRVTCFARRGVACVTPGMAIGLVCILLAGCSSSGNTSTSIAVAPTTATEPGIPEDMASDLGFVAEWGVGRMNTLDTFAGTFTKDLVIGSPPTATADLSLTDEELQEAYERLLEIDIWDYPTDFAPPYADVTDPDLAVEVSPVTSYHLRLVAAGTSKDIWWTNSNGSSASEARALRDWFTWLMALIQSKPEYQAMPPARGGYL